MPPCPPPRDEFAYRACWNEQRAGKPRPYYLRWIDVDGVRRSASYPTRRLRDAARAKIEARLNAWAQSPGDKSWAELVREYGDAHDGLADSSAREIDRVLGYFRQIVAPRNARALTPGAFDRYFAARRLGEPAGQARGKPAAWSLRKEWGILRGFCGWHVARGNLPGNPLLLVARPRGEKRIRRVPELDQLDALLAAFETPAINVDAQAWHVFILVAFVTGLRESAVLRIRLGDVTLGDAESGQVGILRAHSRKTRADSVHGLPPAVNDRLAQRIAALPDGAEYLLPWQSWAGRARNEWAAAMTHSAVKMTPQQIRQWRSTSAAIEAAEAAAARELGHSSPDVTRAHYLDHVAVARAVAARVRLPALRRMPAYRPAVAGVRPSRPRPPAGRNAGPGPADDAAGRGG